MLTQFCLNLNVILFSGVMCVPVCRCVNKNLVHLHMEVKGCVRCLPQLLSTLFIDAESLMEPRYHRFQLFLTACPRDILSLSHEF